MIQLTTEPTDQEIREAIRSWLDMAAAGDYDSAVHAIELPRTSGGQLRASIERFGGPAVRATDEILGMTEIHRNGIPPDCVAVVDFFIPLANGWRLATEFLLKRGGEHSFFKFGIFFA